MDPMAYTRVERLLHSQHKAPRSLCQWWCWCKQANKGRDAQYVLFQMTDCCFLYSYILLFQSVSFPYKNIPVECRCTGSHNHLLCPWDRVRGLTTVIRAVKCTLWHSHNNNILMTVLRLNPWRSDVGLCMQTQKCTGLDTVPTAVSNCAENRLPGTDLITTTNECQSSKRTAEWDGDNIIYASASTEI